MATTATKRSTSFRRFRADIGVTTSNGGSITAKCTNAEGLLQEAMVLACLDIGPAKALAAAIKIHDRVELGGIYIEGQLRSLLVSYAIQEAKELARVLQRPRFGGSFAVDHRIALVEACSLTERLLGTAERHRLQWWIRQALSPEPITEADVPY